MDWIIVFLILGALFAIWRSPRVLNAIGPVACGVRNWMGRTNATIRLGMLWAGGAIVIAAIISNKIGIALGIWTTVVFIAPLVAIWLNTKYNFQQKWGYSALALILWGVPTWAFLVIWSHSPIAEEDALRPVKEAFNTRFEGGDKNIFPLTIFVSSEVTIASEAELDAMGDHIFPCRLKGGCNLRDRRDLEREAKITGITFPVTLVIPNHRVRVRSLDKLRKVMEFRSYPLTVEMVEYRSYEFDTCQSLFGRMEWEAQNGRDPFPCLITNRPLEGEDEKETRNYAHNKEELQRIARTRPCPLTVTFKVPVKVSVASEDQLRQELMNRSFELQHPFEEDKWKPGFAGIHPRSAGVFP